MKYANDRNRLRGGVIHDKVGEDRPELDRESRQILPQMTNFGVSGEDPESLYELL